MRAKKIGEGIAEQIGLARRISLFVANRYLGQAKIPRASELPASFERLTPWREVR